MLIIGSSPALVESLFLSIDPQRVLPGDFFRHQELNGTGEDDDDFQTLYLGL